MAKSDKATKPNLRMFDGIWHVTNKFPDERRWDHKRMHGPTLFPAWELAYHWVIRENTRICDQARRQWGGQL